MANRTDIPPANLKTAIGGWKSSGVFKRPLRTSMGEQNKEVLLSVTALAFGSVGALFGLFVGYAVLGFPICISTTIVGGVFGASLGRYLG